MIVCWPINQFLVNQTFQVSRLRREFPGFGLYLLASRLIKANLPVITNLLNLSVSLVLSPVFFRYSPAFLQFSYFFVSKNPNWVTCYPLPVLNRVFVYIRSKIPTVKSFPRWRRKMRTKIHRNSMKKFLQTKICLYSSPSYNISGQWSNGSASQSFAFGSNLPVLR